MKKILLFIIMFFLVSRVSAETYYSEYTEYSEYQDNIIESSDIVEVEKVSFYELYKENIEYKYLETSDYEETGNIKRIETEWVNDIELLDSTKEIEKRYKYSYFPAKPYKYLVIVNDSERIVSLDTLKITDKIENKVLYESPQVVLYPKDKYVVSLEEAGNLINTKLEVYVVRTDKKNDFIVFSVYAYEDSPMYSNGEFIEKVLGDDRRALLLIDDFSIYNIYPIENTKEYIISEKEVDFLSDAEIIYRNVYDLKEYKIIDRVYTGTYALSDNEEYLIDKERRKDYYRYRTRDKVVINDNLLIDSVDKNLIDFIEYTSISKEDITITSDVNYKVNGNYKINFVLPYKTITKDIVVDIKDNYVNLINEQVQYISELEESAKESTYLVDKKNLEIKDVIVEEETKVIELTESLNSCNRELKELKNQKESLSEETKIKEQSLSYIYVILVLIIFLTFYRVKYLKKNN